MKYKNTIAAAVAVATSAVLYMEREPSTYIHGSWTSAHDIKRANMVDGPVDMDIYCADTTDLKDAVFGSPVISMRANSIGCRYLSTSLPTIAIAGWDNNAGFVGDTHIENALTINAGIGLYGHSINYYIPVGSLSDAMPEMANIVNAINNARRDAGLYVYGIDEMRYVLDNSSDIDHIVEGKYQGQLIDLQKAIELATTVHPSVTVTYMSGIYYILGL